MVKQTFYHIKDTDNKVVDLFENSHRFKLEYVVVAEHERRMETNKLHESYDSIEREDFQLSRGVVESFFRSPSRRRSKFALVTAMTSS